MLKDKKLFCLQKKKIDFWKFSHHGFRKLKNVKNLI